MSADSDYLIYTKWLNRFQRLERMIGESYFNFDFYTKKSWNANWSTNFMKEMEKKYKKIVEWETLSKENQKEFIKQKEKLKENKLKYGSHFAQNIYEINQS